MAKKAKLMWRVLSTSDCVENRAQRRGGFRTSPSMSTKKHTLGRLVPYRDYVKKANEGNKEHDPMFGKLISSLNKKIKQIRRKRKLAIA